uniref:Uncharacterized protein n=1 Tax=Amphimedon queenslandica TaxID=400682 RepID=A0A1X7UV75_AMPQE
MGHFSQLSVLLLIHALLALCHLSNRLATGSLGPLDNGDDDGYCYDESCSRRDSVKQEKRDVKTRGRTGLSGILSNAYDIVASVGEAAINTVHKLSSEVLEDIGDIVKTVINEEALNAIISAGNGALSLIFDSNKAVTGFGSTVLSVSILVGVIFINYLLASYFSLLSILILDAGIILLHGMFGPLQLAKWFITGCSHISQGLIYIIYYPYFSAIVLMLLFIFSCCCWPYLRRQSRYLRNSSDTVFVIEAQLERLEAHLARLETERKERDKEIKAQLDRIERILEKNNTCTATLHEQ